MTSVAEKQFAIWELAEVPSEHPVLHQVVALPTTALTKFALVDHSAKAVQLTTVVAHLFAYSDSKQLFVAWLSLMVAPAQQTTSALLVFAYLALLMIALTRVTAHVNQRASTVQLIPTAVIATLYA